MSGGLGPLAETVKPALRVVIDNSGNVDIDIPGDVESRFDDNIAETLAQDKLATIATQLLSDIQFDQQSRRQWLDNWSRGLDLLALELKDPRSDAADSTAPLEGMSSIQAPLLLSEVLRAQATARGELLPSTGPVKVRDDAAIEGADRSFLADALEKDLNVYLTTVCPEYYPDTDRMLFYLAFGGCGFKKVYHCPLRKRPVSESVDPPDLIVNATATDLQNAKRITHVIQMRQSVVKRLMQNGTYRDVPLTQPVTELNEAQKKEKEMAGIDVSSSSPDDANRTLYEVCCELDLDEGPDGLPLPYRVTLDKDARQILEIRRHWREGDELYQARQLYVRFPYIDAINIYGIGLLNLLGNTTQALTAAEREVLDSGMFASFPGFLYGDNVSRQDTNEMRIPPGGGRRINTGGRPISESVMKLPYNGPSSVLVQFAQWLTETAKALAGSAEIPVGEGQANVPVGTMLAMVEQATIPVSAVHKRLHAAQAEEFALLRDLLREDPDAFWSHGHSVYQWDKQLFVTAINAFELSPVADPNEPTRTHRLMKAQAIKMLSMQSPELYDVKAVDDYVLRLIGVSNPQIFFRPPMPMPNPAEMMMEQKMKEAQLDAQTRIHLGMIKLSEAKMKARVQLSMLEAKQAESKAKLGFEEKKLGAEMTTEAAKGLGETQAELQAQTASGGDK